MSEELIRRSDAIKAVQRTDVGGIRLEDVCAVTDAATDAIKAIPTIEPKTKVVAQVTFDEEKLREIVKKAVERFKEEYEIEPKRGEWINKIVDDVKITVCSNCNKEPTFTHYYGSCGNYSLSDFCPNCGVRMKGADNEASD